MPVRLSPKNVFKISVKKKTKRKKEALYLFQIKTIHTYVKTYFLDYNWTKFGNKKKTTVPSITYSSISISLVFFFQSLFDKTLITLQSFKLISGCCDCTVKKNPSHSTQLRKQPSDTSAYFKYRQEKHIRIVLKMTMLSRATSVSPKRVIHSSYRL